MSDSETPIDRDLQLLKLENERLQIKLGFWKFVFGTAAVSILTAILNWQIQDRQIDHEIRSRESDFIARFIDRALDESLEQRRDFAEYFFRLTPSPEARERWGEYRQYTEELVKKSIEQQIAIESTVQELEKVRRKAGTTKVGVEAPEVAEIEAKLNVQRQELAVLRSETDREAASRSGSSLAAKREREGFSALLEGDVERSIIAFETAERAFPGFHQVYEISRLLRQHRDDFDDSTVRRDVLSTIVGSLSWKAPDDLLEEIRGELRKLERQSKR